MVDPNILSQLAALASGNVDLTEHTNHLVEVLRQTIQKTYIDKFDTILDEYKSESRKQMTDQVNLIEAMKPFFKEEQQTQIEQIGDALMSFSALQRIAEDVQTESAQQFDRQSREEDQSNQADLYRQDLYKDDEAVYEYDNNTYQNDGSPMVMMLLLVMMIGS